MPHISQSIHRIRISKRVFLSIVDTSTLLTDALLVIGDCVKMLSEYVLTTHRMVLVCSPRCLKQSCSLTMVFKQRTSNMVSMILSSNPAALGPSHPPTPTMNRSQTLSLTSIVKLTVDISPRPCFKSARRVAASTPTQRLQCLWTHSTTPSPQRVGKTI